MSQCVVEYFADVPVAQPVVDHAPTPLRRHDFEQTQLTHEVGDRRLRQPDDRGDIAVAEFGEGERLHDGDAPWIREHSKYVRRRFCEFRRGKRLKHAPHTFSVDVPDVADF